MKLISTSDMLETIKEGQVAKCHDIPSYSEQSFGVIKLGGDLYWLEDKDSEAEEVAKVTSHFLGYQWELLREEKEVFFGEAMRAFKKGKTVIGKLDGNTLELDISRFADWDNVTIAVERITRGTWYIVNG